jgi:transcriptional regulator with GAF, ATPase, and Fis domain
MDTNTDITLALRLARISAELIAEPKEYGAVARSIATKATDFIPSCETAAVSRRDRSKLALVAATDDRAAACVETELELGSGPTLTALWHSEVSVAEAIASDIRWPEWAKNAQERGFASALSLRLAVGSERLGALTVLSARRHEWSPRELALAMVFATHASTAMHIARIADTTHFTVEARHRIGMAQGILMHRYGVSKDAAFRLLQRYSNATNTKVRDLAVDVCARGDLPPMPPRRVADVEPRRRPRPA